MVTSCWRVRVTLILYKNKYHFLSEISGMLRFLLVSWLSGAIDIEKTLYIISLYSLKKIKPNFEYFTNTRFYIVVRVAREFEFQTR